jgi:hypothetical protein
VSRTLLLCAPFVLFLATGTFAFTPAAEPESEDNAVIRARAGPSEIVITTTNRVAGAIHSVTWNGKEFVDSTDHGRQLQSAANFDCGKDLIPETYNPTEAGSLADGAGPRSTSKLLRMEAHDNELRSTVQMAFWLAPGEKSLGHPARNTKVLSDHLVRKQVRIGTPGLPQVIDYQVTFTVPKGEKHTLAQFEALTGYMPSEFSAFWKFNAATGRLEELDDTRGEQSMPVVLATANGSHAMGIYSPDQPSPGFADAGYGRFRFKEEKVNKWNCVFRERDPKGIAAGDYSYRMYVAVGTMDDVTRALVILHKEGRKP